jgi:hypothetical protein
MEFSNKLCGNEIADGDISPEQWATAVIKVACILIIGVVILNSVTTAANVTSDSIFYNLMSQVHNNINSGYQLAALMVLSIGAGAILHLLGFM